MSQAPADGRISGNAPTEFLGRKASVSKLLKQGELLHEKDVERVDLRGTLTGLVRRIEGLPSPQVFDLRSPLSQSSLQGYLTEVSFGSGGRVVPVTLGLGGSLPPTIEESRYGGGEGTSKDSSSGGNYRDILEVFLFLWGHNKWVVGLWWACLALVIVINVVWLWEAVIYVRDFLHER
jgi:hypothetical protein